MSDVLEGDNLRDRGTFDDDPTTIPVAPNPDVGEIVFRRIIDKGLPLTLADGTKYTSMGVIATNFNKRTVFINARMKDGDLIISFVKRDEE